MTIISHSRRFIHVHTERTAGSSLEVCLSKYCTHEDIITPEFESERRDRGFQTAANYLGEGYTFAPANDFLWKAGVNAWLVARHVIPLPGKVRSDLVLHSLFFHRKRIVGRHSTSSHVRSVVGDDVWQRYFKLTTIRNPIDSFISFYKCRNGRPLSFDLEQPDRRHAGRSLGLSDFVQACARRFFERQKQIALINEAPALDFYVRFDRIHDDLCVVGERLGVGSDLLREMREVHLRRTPSLPSSIRLSEAETTAILEAAGPLASLYFTQKA